MLAVLAALPLVLFAQVSGPRLVTPEDATLPAAPGPLAQAPDAAPPPGDAAGAPSTPAPAAPPPAAPPSTTGTPPTSTPPATASAAVDRRPRLPSLLGGETLRGASAAFAWAGWSSLGAAYAIGFSQLDDGGAVLDYDWAKSETRLGLVYRRAVAEAGGFDVAVRLGLAYYANFGSDYVYSDNHSDRGFELQPAVALSRRAAGGLFSTSVEAPLTVTTKYGAGILFSPRLAVGFEVPLYPQVTIGARFGIGYRAGAGDAPLPEGRGELQFLVLAGYEL